MMHFLVYDYLFYSCISSGVLIVMFFCDIYDVSQFVTNDTFFTYDFLYYSCISGVLIVMFFGDTSVLS
jgi:hypothetical protein